MERKKNNKESPEIVNRYRRKDVKREVTVLKLEDLKTEMETGVVIKTDLRGQVGDFYLKQVFVEKAERESIRQRAGQVKRKAGESMGDG